jgi:phosphoglucomutase
MVEEKKDMLDTRIGKEYARWVKLADADREVAAELLAIADQDEKIEDAFYRDLEFGTGGLRGVIGAGTNRMNVYTVAKASQGLSDYINKKFTKDARRIAVSYDSRIKSDLFAKVASAGFAANGIEVCIYPELMPTPCLSFAVRELNCAAGIMVTASHNPAKYNGYKVYGADGCQITTEAAKEILAEIEKLDIFDDVLRGDYDESLQAGKISYINENVYTAFVEAVKKQSLLGTKADDPAVIDKNVAIVYTPLNGTGLKPVLRTLKEAGYTNISVVPEQEKPDGNFPTCPYPNPEIREAMTLGITYAKKQNADLLLATDPDCDRVGIAVKDERGLKGERGEYALLSGNETGILLLDYICSRRIEAKTMPEDPVMIKTIVTSDMAKQVADHYQVRTVDVLTGFKFIGEQIGLLEAQGKVDSYIFGMEESYGYLSGSYVRDKDAVDGAFLICEMFAYYKTRGVNLLEKLDELYAAYGYRLNTLHSYAFEGAAGMEKMKQIMEKFRGGFDSFGGKAIVSCLDYVNGIDGLPKSNVLKFLLADNCSVVVRPSGTEPKLKLYISVTGSDMPSAENLEEKIVKDLENICQGKNG